MNYDTQKIRPEHLRRDAYLYVRQSTLRQVVENTESTERQYALRERAVALGWPRERVVVIDSDQGQSGADADRVGFQRLVAEVGMGRAGIVLGLEVSRLARNCADWHRLLEICALAGTLILDEDGLYDPQCFNDRLLLGLKGTMSEAELHLLRARLRGGILSKARRGELRMPMPVGLVRDERGAVVLDPDRQVRQALQHLFAAFRATGSALAVVKRFRREGWLFPRRARGGANRGELLWGPLGHTQVLNVLHNPRYAGAYVFGRNRVYRTAHGTSACRRLPQDEWSVLLLDNTPGYIGWDEFQENQRRLQENARAFSDDRRHGPPGTGCALLQGIAVCGACGGRMTVRYYHRFGRTVPWYVCQREGIERGERFCESLPGQDIDGAVAELLLQRLTPAAVELAEAVQRELAARREEADALRRRQVERARYEADLARRRYAGVDPANRLVADTLEAEWESKLRVLREAEEQYERQRRQGDAALDQATRRELRALAEDFPRLWRDAGTSDQDRKRITRVLIEDVTIVRKLEELVTHVRFKGGATQTLRLPRPKSAGEQRKTDAAVMRRIDELLDTGGYAEVAAALNAEGLRTGTGQAFTAKHVGWLRWAYRLRSRFQRLRSAGYFTLREMAAELGVSFGTVKHWYHAGLIRGQVYNDRGEVLYEPPGKDRPTKQQGRKIRERSGSM